MVSTCFLVVGANRGIGYEFTRQLLQTPEHKVIATYRDPSSIDAFTALTANQDNRGRLALVELDMNDAEKCKSAADRVKKYLGKLNVLIVNAGKNAEKCPLLEEHLDNVADMFANNTLGPLRICQYFVPLLDNSKPLSKVVLISSEAGSITVQKNLRSPAYGISKAALNMAGRKLSAELEPLKVSVALVHPGWVKTELGGPNAQITPEDSVAGMLEVIDKLDMTNSGEFWVYDGQNHPW
ncbi:short-chain dehydrogenase/reductase SDR [Rhizoctonia solani 123E]|uniref:Short-chain dehydrogenase/reductase SDR n=1 Tax=Rhizoctonia solani 123E TaxID=1423351 RepID=A0A074RER7_9AGAM|nr:short-chain dehydrogenase/reductase SDR [Rhizoctonia solani 123E]